MATSWTLRLWLWVLILTCAQTLQGQAFKRLYSLDTATFSSVGTWTARDLVVFDGDKMAITGAISGGVPLGGYRQSVYVLQVDGQGEVIRYDEFEDNSDFVFQSPLSFGICHDGASNFYLAAGANSRQVVLKSQVAGGLEWARVQHHHEFYDIVCEDTAVVFAGQDESVQGLHDFSISRLDAQGGGGFGYMYGTSEFELPDRLLPLPGGGFLMVGTSSGNGSFRPMMVRVDASLQMVWGYLYADTTSPRRLICKAAATDSDHGIWVAGTQKVNSAGQVDSLVLMRFDSTGAFVWGKNFGHSAWTSANLVDMELDAAGNVLMAANVQDGGYFYPVLVQVDGSGQVLEAQSFDDADTTTEETWGGIVWSQNNLYGVGDRTQILPGFLIKRELFWMRLTDSLTMGCQQEIQVGQSGFGLQASGGILTQPYQVLDTFPIQAHNGNVLGATACFLPVSMAGPLGSTPVLKYMNPASQFLNVEFSFPLGGGNLELRDLTGALKGHFQNLPESGELQLGLEAIPSGMYLLRAYGQGWRSEVQKLWVVRP